MTGGYNHKLVCRGNKGIKFISKCEICNEIQHVRKAYDSQYCDKCLVIKPILDANDEHEKFDLKHYLEDLDFSNPDVKALMKKAMDHLHEYLDDFEQENGEKDLDAPVYFAELEECKTKEEIYEYMKDFDFYEKKGKMVMQCARCDKTKVMCDEQNALCSDCDLYLQLSTIRSLNCAWARARMQDNWCAVDDDGFDCVPVFESCNGRCDDCGIVLQYKGAYFDFVDGRLVYIVNDVETPIPEWVNERR